MTPLAHWWAIFTDPLWGPVSLDISVWREPGDDAPKYVVLVD